MPSWLLKGSKERMAAWKVLTKGQKKWMQTVRLIQVVILTAIESSDHLKLWRYWTSGGLRSFLKVPAVPVPLLLWDQTLVLGTWLIWPLQCPQSHVHKLWFFLASFPQEKLMGKPTWKVVNRSAKSLLLTYPLPANNTPPTSLRLCLLPILLCSPIQQQPLQALPCSAAPPRLSAHSLVLFPTRQRQLTCRLRFTDTCNFLPPPPPTPSRKAGGGVCLPVLRDIQERILCRRTKEEFWNGLLLFCRKKSKFHEYFHNSGNVFWIAAAKCNTGPMYT